MMEAGNLKTVVLIGRTGSGKSTIANMLVKGDLDPPHQFKIGHGMRGTTLSCTKSEGRGWTVVDSVGFGEGLTGSVSDENAKEEIINFLKDLQMEYSHIIFVHKKGRCDELTEIMWMTFQEIFKGAESNFVVFVTDADEDYMEENLDDLKTVFKGCDHFVYADFPPNDKKYPAMEEELRKEREDERNRLERELLTMFTSPGKPDFCDMSNEQMEKKAESILRVIARIAKALVDKYGPKIISAISIFVNVAFIVAEYAAA